MECSRQRCHRRASALGLCKTHLTDKADHAFSRAVRNRDGYCTAALFFPDTFCLGQLQCMHLVGRNYRALRWDMGNATAGCAAHHLYLTEHPLEHHIFCEKLLGTVAWTRLYRRRFDMPMRPEDAIEALKVSA